MIPAYDLLVVGAGPAGAAAAITAASRGLRVLLLDRAAFPRFRPGECLHPGAEALLSELRVWSDLAGSVAVRPSHRRVIVAGTTRHEPFGADVRGSWKAIHIWRSTLDYVLLKGACRMGAAFSRIEDPMRLMTDDAGVVKGLQVAGEAIPCRFLVDASGSTSWLNRQLGLRPQFCSPRLTTFSGYCEGAIDHEQIFESEENGWRWFAQVDVRTVNWTQLTLGIHKKPPTPTQLSRLIPLPPACCGFDVTWRRAHSLAGPGYLVTGDAAFVLDPSYGGGVLHALMSGMYAGEAVVSVLEGRAEETAVRDDYVQWSDRWLAGATAALSGTYGRLFSSSMTLTKAATAAL